STGAGTARGWAEATGVTTVARSAAARAHATSTPPLATSATVATPATGANWSNRVAPGFSPRQAFGLNVTCLARQRSERPEDASVIRETLAGQRIAVTGATGFLGTALVERPLRPVPECDVVLLVRAGRRTTAREPARPE